nr:M13 family metallopeptidase [Duganella sp. 1224]
MTPRLLPLLRLLPLVPLLFAAGARGAPPPTAGIDRAAIDPAVRSQDDFFQHMNGRWLATTAIPPDRPSWGAYQQLADQVLPQLRTLLDNAIAQPDATPDSRRLADFYASYMDEDRLEQLGLTPLREELARVDALSTRQQLPQLIAHLQQLGISALYSVTVDQDSHQATRYALLLDQDGLGLPDRDDYLRPDDARAADLLQRYQRHVAQMLTLAGVADADANARAVLAFEQQLARLQWTAEQLRDPAASYNPRTPAQLAALTPSYDWRAYLRAAGLQDTVAPLIIGQPGYFQGMAALLDRTPLSTLQAYFKWQLLHACAPYLNRAAADANFAFYGQALSGTAAQPPRWKRGVRLINDTLGEALGQLYVRQYFPPERKQRMAALVRNLLDAYRADIDQLDWMGPDTKRAAQAKLAKLTVKIGYPDRWRDDSALLVRRDDLLGNVLRWRQSDYARRIGKLDGPVDRAEWGLPPQTVNAYYNPQLNEVVFPAAMLQAPFFDADADDAVNYGAIGAVIGHEISHAFDDHGARYDGDGNLRDWWRTADHQAFEDRIARLTAQYDQFSPLPGQHVNGALTRDENIADNSGLAIAYQAWTRSLHGAPAPVIDGLSGEQRFYMGYAQSRRVKMLDAELIRRLKTDVHAPGAARTNIPLRNQPDFYRAFDVQPGDRMYLPPAQRVRIW